MSNWISVKERLPEKLLYVLVYAIDSGGYSPTRKTYPCAPQTAIDYLENNGKWSSGHLRIKITHWQPLPAPPEEKENNDE
jgi:hypothetical protein